MKNMTAAVLALVIAGCGSDDSSSGGSDGGPSAPVGIIPLVMNAPDAFSVAPLGPVLNGTYSYAWQCTADQANLTISAVMGGSIRIKIVDSTDTLIHDNTIEGGLAGTLVGMTSPDGQAGLWTIEFTYTDITSVGLIDLQADLFQAPDTIQLAGAYDLQTSFVYKAAWGTGCGKAAIASSLSYGLVHIRMWDGNGDLVLSCSGGALYTGSTPEESLHGAAGVWTIRIDVDAVSTAGSITITHP